MNLYYINDKYNKNKNKYLILKYYDSIQTGGFINKKKFIHNIIKQVLTTKTISNEAYNKLSKPVNFEPFLNLNNGINKPLIFIENWNNVRKFNKITDNFSKKQRYQCRMRNFISPEEYELRKLTEPDLIKPPSCSNFNITRCMLLMYSLFGFNYDGDGNKYVQGKYWLDFSSGWGDRLISACIMKMNYYGFDPNISLQTAYNNIISSFADSKYSYVVIPEPSEKSLKIPDFQFDVAFTSPPFFDLETYTNINGQSIISYNTEELWYNNFLVAVVDKTCDLVKYNGFFALYIGEGQNTSYVNKIIDYITHKKDWKYIGRIFFAYDDALEKIRGIFIWKKIKLI
jgi:hypothetical protein